MAPANAAMIDELLTTGCRNMVREKHSANGALHYGCLLGFNLVFKALLQPFLDQVDKIVNSAMPRCQILQDNKKKRTAKVDIVCEFCATPTPEELETCDVTNSGLNKF